MTPDEERMLDQVAYDLQMRYVEMSQGGPIPPARGRAGCVKPADMTGQRGNRNPRNEYSSRIHQRRRASRHLSCARSSKPHRTASGETRFYRWLMHLGLPVGLSVRHSRAGARGGVALHVLGARPGGHRDRRLRGRAHGEPGRPDGRRLPMVRGGHTGRTRGRDAGTARPERLHSRGGLQRGGLQRHRQRPGRQRR